MRTIYQGKVQAVAKCPKCGTALEEGAEPVTVSGVYEDYRVQWGFVGGVHTTRRVAIVCHACGTETSLANPFD